MSMNDGPSPSTAPSGSGSSHATGSSSSHGKARSCAVCARRKVSCDKHFPCGRCQRAGVRCVLPSVESRPRWARRLVQSSATEQGPASGRLSSAGLIPEEIVHKVQQLEDLVQSLRGELEHARTPASATGSQGGTHPSTASSGRATDAGPAGRSAGRGEDLNSTFWTGIDRELSGVRFDDSRREGVEQETTADDLRSNERPSSLAVAARHGAMSGHTFLFVNASALSDQETSRYLPMASQMPFLLEVFAERVHSVLCVPHMPSLKALMRRRQMRGGGTVQADEEALLFAVFYAALCSLDDEEVDASFNVAKIELASNYRRGLEAALARADFMNNPSHDIVQALLIFLALARLHDGTKYLWMMTGLVIRMARFLRYHEDGTSSKRVTPFQTEMQRRIWWNLCALDMRSTEDQGTELASPEGSFTAALPSNVEDSDLSPQMDWPPQERPGLTSISLLRLCSKVVRSTQRMIAMGSTVSVENYIRLLDDLSQELDRDYFSIADQSRHPAYLPAAGTMRVFLGRLTLLAFLPSIFSSPSADFSAAIRNKMFVAAIEIAELNHALNMEPNCQPWRWVYQTQQHWHAVVYLLIELCRRPWSPTVERAWLALQSPWLLPARASSYSNPNVWIPLKKLMARARSHRGEEVIRLRYNSRAAEVLQKGDQEQIPVPSSSVTFPTYYNEEMFRERWWQLLHSETATGGTLSDTCGGTRVVTVAETARPGSAPAANASNQIRQSPAIHARGQDATISRTDAPYPSTGSFNAPAIATNDPSNLETFLGTDADMQFPDMLGDEDFLHFDWNSWLHSASGA